MAEQKRNKRPFEEPSEKINLTLNIKSQDGTICGFKANPSSLMKDVFKAYARKKQIIDYKTVRFFFDSQRLRSGRTVNELGLQDGDMIDAMLYQDGGGPAN
ncbi:small ubiquitin-related modifier 2-like [Lycium barbarum]|uniref:small ubiquitin-related modifier 2-like n=1 Tax=Lycium barbarum TaxID=112863 RepID=UPI00293E64AA|nr:small ubiquitin-related modifier 2-like [Lycium barbarum]